MRHKTKVSGKTVYLYVLLFYVRAKTVGHLFSSRSVSKKGGGRVLVSFQLKDDFGPHGEAEFFIRAQL